MPDLVKPKKSFGQHFLKDKNIAAKIVNSLKAYKNHENILEVGPGTGILTEILINEPGPKWFGIEIDKESIAYLNEKFPQLSQNIIEADFLTYDLKSVFGNNAFAIIGNFPYNISSQIVFKILEYRDQVPEMVGMFQKEVALRICSKPGNKVYGILSVLTQAFYNVEYLFQVNENVFFPPPKVKSAVIRLDRNNIEKLPCNENMFFTIVKTAFNQRRKTLRNSLKSLNIAWEKLPEMYAGKRPEQLSPEEFYEITNAVSLTK